MSVSQNGWPVLDNRTSGGHPRLRKWAIGNTGRHLLVRDGSAGFLLAHMALWWHENVAPINTGIWDEWGWAARPVRGATTGFSNHASGTAADINATKHPRGVPTGRNLNAKQQRDIREQLKVYDGCLRWGGDYQTTPDAMHFEINRGMPDVERVARRLTDSPYGSRILDANPGAAAVIWDGKPPTDEPAKPPTPDTGVDVPEPVPALTRGPRIDGALDAIVDAIAEIDAAKPSPGNKKHVDRARAQLVAARADLRSIEAWSADPNPLRR